ncbi:obscurin-like isoform X4 [Varroa destructor]|uniref:Muscle M-line assembly protein unc-89 n=1 Tax=Varroa destructor TaxID=109461 RepID=A0A7M7KRP3_VARDE|nr:obscurin-like isoform X4 [Varroa destructor]
MSYRYTSSSYKYSSTGEEDSSSVRRSSFRSRASIDDENLMSSVSRSTRITRTLISGSDEPATTTSTISTTRRRLTSDDDDFGLSRRSFDDDSISRFSRQLAEEASDEAFSSKRTKVEMEGGITGYSTRSSKITHIDSGEVKSFETSSKQSYSSTFGSEGGDLQMLEDSSPVGSIYVTILDYKPLTTDEDGLVLKEGDEVKVLETGKPRKWKVFKMSTGQSGWVGSYCLEKTAGAVATTERVTSMQEKKISEVYLTRKETLVKELVETEEDFARDMLYVVNNYMKEMDNPAMPKRLREFKDQLFCNFKDICDFHNDQLITGIKFNAREPTKLGTTLLRMERDFDKHVKYVEQEHKAQQLLKDEPELREYLERFSKKIGDEKTIQEHLKLPLQRINDYQLILKELIKCNAKAGEDFNDLQRALDFMQAIPQRSVDLDYINRMEGYSGNIQKFGRILKEGKVLVTDLKGRIQERHAFLFRGGRLCLTEVQFRGVSQKEIYIMKSIIKTTGTTVSEEAGNLKLTSTSEGPIIMKVDDKEEWSKQLQASTVKSEVVEKMTADEELRVKEEEVSTRIEITQEDDANRTTTTGVSDLEPRGTSPTSGEKPKFVQTLRGISTHRNDTATLECIIESEPAPQLKWLKNNVPVRKGPRITQFSDSKTGRHSLTISNAQPEDAAMYTIVASNPSGTTSCSAPFNVRTASGRPDSRPTSPGGTELPFAPVFKVKLKDTELLEGTSVRFELVVHGFPTPEVAFYKDGEPLQMDDRIRVHYENKEVFELIIDHVTEQDSAVYSCVAMNSEGCDSTAGCITVTKSKVLFQGLTEDGNAGDKSTTPQPTVSPAFTWFKDGKEFEASERFQVAFNDDEDTLALVFQHVKPEDAGIYTCVASTYSGKISCSAELTVQGAVNYKEPSAPTIEANIEDVEVSEGASAMLELKITGWPKPRIVWTKGEKLIESGYGGKYKFLFEDDESMTLVIRSVTKEDAGKYDIVAENELGSASTHCNLHVKCPPKFKKELKDASVMTETPLKLDVEVEGLPEPDVKWYKDGQQVFNTERVKLVHQVDSASYALVVDKAKVDDAGSYTCVISNPLGSQSGHAAVTVNSAPKIIKKLESYEATITETVKLSTKIAGVPKPKVEWLKNGQAVLIDGKKYVASEDETNVFSLTIDCCGPDDVGSYTVVVTNDYGKAEDSAQLTIKIKPKFTRGLKEKELVESEVDIELTVVVEAQPEPTVQWWHDGVLIKDSNLYVTKAMTENGQYTLVIKQAVAEAGGTIKCTAENKHGKANTEAKVTVNAKPKITEGLKNQSVVTGADATFTIKYAGAPKPEATWMKDGAEIKVDGSHYRVSEAEAQYTLVIKDCKDDDKGLYKAVIENKYGRDESSAELKVVVTMCDEVPPIFVRELENVSVNESERAEFIAECKSLPEANVRWKRGEMVVADHARYEVSSDGGVHKLVIKEATEEDVGIYSIEASNPAGSAHSEAKLTVYAPPKFIDSLKDIFAVEGESVSFSVVVAGSPDPEILWKHNEEAVQISSEIQGRENGQVKVLIIDGVTKDHIGNYVCVAKNPYGQSSSQATLTIQDKPRFLQKPENAILRKRENAIFRAKITGYPEPAVTWSKSGVEVNSDDKILLTAVDGIYSLNIQDLGDDDVASYTCSAKNEHGEVSESADLTLIASSESSEKAAPSFLRKPQDVVTMEGEDVRIYARVIGQPEPEVRWVKTVKDLGSSLKIDNERCQQDGDMFTLFINKCSRDDEASYTCVATNPQGSVQESASLTILLPQAPTIEHIEDQKCCIGERVRFSVIVQGVPTPSVKWFRNDSTVEETDNVTIASFDKAHSLTIKEVTILDFAMYTIHAENSAGEANASAVLLEKVIAKPLRTGVSLEQLSPLEVQPGESIVLKTKVSINDDGSLPEIKWFKNDEPITSNRVEIEAHPDGSILLKVAFSEANDEGVYTVKARNEHGVAEASAPVKVFSTCTKVIKPPTFAQGLKPSKFVEGGVGRLDAKLNPNDDGSMPDVEWLKNGNPLTEADGVRFIKNPDGTVALEIPKCKPEDAGKYTLRVKNPDGGIAESSAPVEVSRNVPVFEIQLKGLNLTEGDELKLVCKVNSDTAITAKWFRDGVEVAPDPLVATKIEPDGSVLLTIASCIPGDAGKYRCEVTNQTGTSSSEANVSVKALKREKPIIIDGLKATAFDEDKPGKVEAKVGGFPKPDVHWLKDGKPITDPRIKIETKPDGTTILAIDKVKPEDAGEYSIVAKNDQGENKSSAPVTVNKKPSFLKPLEACTVHTSETAKLTSKVVGLPKPKIEWLKDGKPIKPDGNRIVAAEDDEGNCNLTIKDATPADAGNYAIKATNPSGEMKSEVPVEIIDDKAPTFLSPLKDQNVPEGGKLVLEARVTGSTALKIKWFHKGKPITEADDASTSFNGETARLEIPKTAMAHAGEYECKLLSPAGEKSSKANVKVLRPPKFIKPLLDTDVPLSMPLVLECEVLCDDEPEVAWTFRGAPIHDGSKYTITKINGRCKLFIANPSINDCGEYQCSAKNAAGQDSTACKGTIKEPAAAADSGEPPSFLKKLTDQEVTVGSTAKLIACIAGKPEPDVEWYKDGSNVALTDRHSFERDRNGIIRLVIQNLTERDFGEYRCEISNPHGKADCSCKLSEDSTDFKHLKKDNEKPAWKKLNYQLSEKPKPGLKKPVESNVSDDDDEHSDTDDFGFERPTFDGEKPSVVKYLRPDTGVPPATDAPDIIRMTDYDCTLRWKPSVPKGPRIPVTYRVEMCDHPGGAWKPYASGIKDTTTDVKGLRPGQDYQFRVLVESKHGLSEPSVPVTAHRSKLVEKEDRPEKEFIPKDIDLGHGLDKEGVAPYFVRKEEEVMFGVKGRPVSIEFWVYGLPHPQCTWFFKEQKIESGGRYEKLQDRNGQVLLCINRMQEDCEGVYTCKALNEHGEATKSIQVKLAEEPQFTKRLEYTTVLLRKSGVLSCRCIGKPYPHIRWYKDWQPIATSGRIQISWEEPDLCTMKLDDSIMRDAGLYSCKATNIAGDATCSATVIIEEEEELYDLSTYKAPRVVRSKTKPLSDYYDLGDELGRGTQGITYHAVARATGNSYAAKVMKHTDPQFRTWMKNEMDMMNQLAHPKLCRMWDVFESQDSMTLIMDLCGGGELLSNIIHRGGVTEGQIANFIRQTLQGLDYMHQRGIAHLGLTLGDLLVARVNADDIKISDFSLATRIHNDRNFIQEYGHPEYVAPELAKKEPATLASDMWSVGVITYILLSGVSPFLGEHDRETLSNIKDGKMNFLPEGFDGVSDDARDFVAKLMVFEPDGRLNVKQALNHPWLKMADLPDRGPKLSNLERLLDYQEKWRKWYANANCRTCFRRRTLESCFYDPSKMIYPPGEPSMFPETPARKQHVVPSFDNDRKKRGYDTENFKNESNYAQGPDTYLLQLRDTDFPLRLRQYMKVGVARSPSLAESLRGQHWGGSDIFARGQEREHIYPQVVIRERRKFYDMMDEEIDDEKKGGDDHKSIMLRLNKEVGAVGYIKNETDAVRNNAWRFRGVTREQAIGTLPFFREKIDDAVIMDNNNVSFHAVAVGIPAPQFTWFRNDCPLIPTSRIKIDTNEAAGISTLTLAPGMAYDAGVFKCVARNASGTAVCRARLRIGDIPGRPAAPRVVQATARQMYIEWNAPRQENNARTLYFTLEYKLATAAEWTKIPEKITNEFYILEDLIPATKYEFRVIATNLFGNSVTSDASKSVATEAADSTNKIKLSPTHSYQQVQTTDIAVGSAPVHDYSREQNPIELKTSDIKNDYNFSAELCSGRFSVVMSGTVKANNRLIAVKAVKNGRHEYDMLKGLVHRNIVYLEDAYQAGDVTMLVMERLSMNILAFLTLRNTYSEDQVSRIMKQVFDALEYLHFKGLVYCNVEPDSVCVTDGQSCIVKLVDFGSTHAVPKEGARIVVDCEPEYMAPEVVHGELVTYAADVWSAGVLMYILLSGLSPFLGQTEAETRENVTMVRFHFEHIYHECSSEATKFLIQVFKKCPMKRATIEECYENRWMLPSEYMLRKREACVFKSEKLTKFAQSYERAKRNRDNACQMLSSFGLNRITSPEA